MQKTSFAMVYFAIYIIFSSTALAQAVSPSNALWIIDEENTGAPGRGFQTDMQNDTIVLTFYGYQESGPATFYQAVGTFAPGSNEITMPMLEFANGTALGGDFQNAEQIGQAGDVTFRVFDLNHGEICLPGEECKTTSTFNFGFQPVQELLGEWVLVTSGFDTNVWLLEFNNWSGERATGDATIKSEGFDFTVDLFCELSDSPQPYRYSCGVEEFGEVERFQLNVSRNALAGETSDFEDLIGWRLKNESGRSVLPN